MTRIKTDYDEVITVAAEDGGDIVLGIAHGIGSTEATLRPSQAERLAADLLAYANGDHLLPPDAVRPQRVVIGTPTPRDEFVELEARQNELYLAMGVVEKMPASEAQTACVVKLGERMRLLVEKRGKSEVGRGLS